MAEWESDEEDVEVFNPQPIIVEPMQVSSSSSDAEGPSDADVNGVQVWWTKHPCKCRTNCIDSAGRDRCRRLSLSLVQMSEAEKRNALALLLIPLTSDSSTANEFTKRAEKRKAAADQEEEQEKEVVRRAKSVFGLFGVRVCKDAFLAVSVSGDSLVDTLEIVG